MFVFTGGMSEMSDDMLGGMFEDILGAMLEVILGMLLGLDMFTVDHVSEASESCHYDHLTLDSLFN